LDDLNARHRKKKRKAGPSYGLIDARSVETQYDSDERGFDGGKWVKGHKRHIVVDILGHLLHVEVHAANLSDTVRGCEVLCRAAEKHPTI
jgi:putative transposase